MIHDSKNTFFRSDSFWFLSECLQCHTFNYLKSALPDTEFHQLQSTPPLGPVQVFWLSPPPPPPLLTHIFTPSSPIHPSLPPPPPPPPPTYPLLPSPATLFPPPLKLPSLPSPSLPSVCSYLPHAMHACCLLTLSCAQSSTCHLMT